MVAKDTGFVLKRYDFRETSLITALYTANFGKITGILKGFYTFKKEFSSTLEPFSLNEFIFYPKKRDIWLISFADLVTDYDFLRLNPAKARTAAMIFDLVDKVMLPWDKNQEVYALLNETMTSLGTNDERKALYLFLIKFLTLSGFKPEFNRCLHCHNELTQHFFFSVSHGGLICKQCGNSATDTRKLNAETVSCIRYVQNADLPQAFRLTPTFKCIDEIFYVLREFLCYHLDFDINVPVFAKNTAGRHTRKSNAHLRR